MKSKKIVYTIFKTCVAFVVVIIIVAIAYKLCVKSYDFGYRIFAEEPLSPAPGITISVAIVEGKSASEIGQILKEKGLIRDAYLFYLQEMVSGYHGKLKPGVYELSTAMTPEEMMAIMAAEPSETEEDLSEASSSSADENTEISEGVVSEDDTMEDAPYEGVDESEESPNLVEE